MKKPKIKEINYGLGYTVCNGNKPLYIELNKNLKKYPKLRKKVLKHELLHWGAGGWLDNLKIDFFDIFNTKDQREYFMFQMKHPKAFLSNSPVLIDKGKIIPNWFMIYFWGTLLIITIGGISLVI